MNHHTHIPSGHALDDRQHSRLLRLFTVSCMLSAVLILALVGVSIYGILTFFILSDAEKDAVNLGNALLEYEMKTFMSSDPEGNTNIVINEKDFSPFDRNVQKNLGFSQVFKVKIYSENRKIAYSTDHGIVGRTVSDNESLDKALKGEVVSALQSGRDLWDLDDEQKLDMDMVETYLPIKDMKDRVVGAFEIYMDVSEYRKGIRNLLASSLAALFFILAGIFGVLLHFMRQSTKTIYSKTQELRILSGLLPICSFCKKIRNNEGIWEPLEKYITERTDSTFTHGMCPECRDQHYPET